MSQQVRQKSIARSLLQCLIAPGGENKKSLSSSLIMRQLKKLTLTASNLYRSEVGFSVLAPLLPSFVGIIYKIEPYFCSEPHVRPPPPLSRVDLHHRYTYLENVLSCQLKNTKTYCVPRKSRWNDNCCRLIRGWGGIPLHYVVYFVGH